MQDAKLRKILKYGGGANLPYKNEAQKSAWLLADPAPSNPM